MAGPVPETAREARTRENDAALGGMRNPSDSLAKLPGLAKFGQKLSAIIDKFIEDNPDILKPVESIRSGKPEGF